MHLVTLEARLAGGKRGSFVDVSIARPEEFDKAQNGALRAEFEQAFRAPGVKYLGAACALGACTVFAYYLLDVFHTGLPKTGGVQSVRLLLVGACAFVAALCWANVAIATRYYGLIFGGTTTAIVAAGCLISYMLHSVEQPIALIWGTERVLLISIVVVMGFSRLTALSTLALVSVVPITIVAGISLNSPPSVTPHLIRMTIQLSLVAACCYFLRQSIQTREWKLFLLARENLRNNKYAKQLERAKLAAEEADNAKARFLANMSHEVRTPMNGVLQILEVVGEHVNEQDRALIDKARKAGYALLRILNGILDYSKAAHAEADVNLSEIDIVDVCRTVAELHTAAAVSKGIDFRSRLDLPPTGESLVSVDEVKLFEIINNLVSNALKFTSRGFVELVVGLSSSALPHATLNIRVSDSGDGIGENELEKVFLPFYQRRRDGPAASRGTGLGLSIVKQLVHALGGEITLRSELGCGSAFSVGLPVTLASLNVEARGQTGLCFDSGESSQDRRDSRLNEGEFEAFRLLLVDDNELNAMLAARLLAAVGFKVVTAANGALALEAVQRQDFDIILMDCQMPVLDGYGAARAIRELEARGLRPRTPVIAVTAYALAGDREKCLAAGMDDFLAKPYALNDLRPKLRRWLGASSHAMRE